MFLGLGASSGQIVRSSHNKHVTQIAMTRTKPKYAPEPEPQQQASTSFAGLPYSLDLKGASAYTDFSITDIRAAIIGRELPIVSDKPYRMIRTDLEKWVEAKRHFVRRMAEKR